LPNDKSRVDLDPDRRDRHGVPLPRISAYLEPGDIARLRFMATKSRELLAASGAPDIFETYSSWDWFGATHVFGTCRMGTDPSTSVVNAAGQSHRWTNLWIAGRQCFSFLRRRRSAVADNPGARAQDSGFAGTKRISAAGSAIKRLAL
jgi:choline dehydrogenase-like flavoprotein